MAYRRSLGGPSRLNSIAETVTASPLQALVDVDRSDRARAAAASRDADLGVGALHVGRGGAAQLLDDVHRLGGAGRPQGVALAQEAARQVDGDLAVDPGGPVGRAGPAAPLLGEAQALDAAGLLDGERVVDSATSTSPALMPAIA